MSAGVFCMCSGKLEERRKNWRVTSRRCNHSLFNGGRRASSDYSGIICLKCRGVWRSKGKYTSYLADYTG